MWNALFLFRVLLPPMLLIHPCLFRPAHQEKKQLDQPFDVMQWDEQLLDTIFNYSLDPLALQRSALSDSKTTQLTDNNMLTLKSLSRVREDMLPSKGMSLPARRRFRRLKKMSKLVNEPADDGVLLSEKGSSVFSAPVPAQRVFVSDTAGPDCPEDGSCERLVSLPLESQSVDNIQVESTGKATQHITLQKENQAKTYLFEGIQSINSLDGTRLSRRNLLQFNDQTRDKILESENLTQRNNSIGTDMTKEAGPQKTKKKNRITLRYSRIRRSLNRSETPAQARTGLHLHQHSTEPPDYMVRLFFLLSETHYDILVNTVVTAFLNINEGETQQTTEGDAVILTNTLAFEAVLSEDREVVEYAEIRLFLSQHVPQLPDTDNSTPDVVHTTPNKEHTSSDLEHTTPEMEHSTSDIEHKTQRSLETPPISPSVVRVNIYELLSSSASDQNFDNATTILVYSGDVQVGEGDWESFNVSSDVKQWHSSGLRVFEIRLEYKIHDESDGSGRPRVAISTESGKDPLLVVFSRKTKPDVSKDRIRRDVRSSFHSFRDNSEDEFRRKVDVPKRKQSAQFLSTQGEKTRSKQHSPTGKDARDDDRDSKEFYKGVEESGVDSVSKEILHLGSIFGNDLSRSLMQEAKFNNFDSTTFHARSVGENINEDAFGHRNSIRTKESLNGRIRASNDVRGSVHGAHTDVDNQGGDTDVINRFDNHMLMREERTRKRRFRRHVDSLSSPTLQTALRRRTKRSKWKRNSCRRVEMYVDFGKIKWDKLIIFPRGYQAFECRGKCYTPISKYLTPTNHAIIQTKVHASYPKQASRACCVPTRLDPISILYWDEHGEIKYEYTYHEMVATECGCR
ncbi:uncharacterized protein LOC101854803 [Aplysia californica]|uniref:Uncharacterized protein LOC101854803 n=1 Tax=Aplysia californica TaxID=6500 RepID=A0ABM0JRZ6_APLCA|nr:uncharacterized protein LOC101854803 [Aplysia californica]